MASKSHWTKKTYHLHPGITLFLSVMVLLMASLIVSAQSNNSNGFDQYGYNYKARLYQGAADGVDRRNDGTVWGDSYYAADHLVMKWSKAWDDARFKGQDWTCDAWTDNEWNGQNNGSGEVWHYKIVWVGPEHESSKCWKAGGYSIWGDFEVIMSQGSVANQHFFDAHAIPSGYGMMSKP